MPAPLPVGLDLGRHQATVLIDLQLKQKVEMGHEDLQTVALNSREVAVFDRRDPLGFFVLILPGLRQHVPAALRASITLDTVCPLWRQQYRVEKNFR